MLINENNLLDTAADKGYMSETCSGIIPWAQLHLTAQTPQTRVSLVEHEQV
jgi:hypothetical protein